MRPFWGVQLALLAVACGGPTVAGAGVDPSAPAPTLEEIFGGDTLLPRSPSEATWSHDGASLYYQLDESGQVSWWRHDVRTGRSQRVADWTRLENELQAQRPGWVEPVGGDANAASAAGKALAWHPREAVVAGLLAGDIYQLDLRSGQARFVTQDAAPELFPTFSPDGRRLAFVRDGDLHVLELASGSLRRLTDRSGGEGLQNGAADWASEEELDVERSFWWSPDGRQLAYLQYDVSALERHPIVDDLASPARLEVQRYPRPGQAIATVRLGLVGVDGGPTRWLDLGSEAEFYLPRAGFTPDGQGLWFVWLARDQRRLELRLCELASGRVRTLVQEQAESWVEVGPGPLFVDSQRFVWTSDRDGWRHLYLFGLDGALQRRLTSGAWQVEDLYGLDAARRNVFFLATERDPRQRQVYSVGLDGQGLTRLSREDGTHAALFAPAGGAWLDTFSSVDRPTRAALFGPAGRLLSVLTDGSVPVLAGRRRSPIELGSFEAEPGLRLYTGMVKPPDFDPARRYPAVLYVYGGPHVQTVLDQWDGRRRLFFEHLASRGLLVFWLDNRGSAGRGRAFASALRGRLGEWEVRDQLAGLRYLKGLPFVDPDRVAAYGGSYGGFMTLMLLLAAPDQLAGGVAYAPVTDWQLYDAIYTERYLGRPQANPEGYAVSAPLQRAAQLRSRLLLFHGTLDNNVHIQHTLRFVDALHAAGKEYDLVLYPRVRHGIRVSARKLDFHRRTAAWLERLLLGTQR